MMQGSNQYIELFDTLFETVVLKFVTVKYCLH